MAPTVDRSQRYKKQKNKKNKSNRKNEEDARVDPVTYALLTPVSRKVRKRPRCSTKSYQSFPGSLESGPTSNHLKQPLEATNWIPTTLVIPLTIVLHGAKASWKVEMVFGPTSSPIQSSGMLSTATVSDPASGANCAEKN